MGYYYGVFSLLTWEGVSSPLSELKYRCWLIRNCVIFYLRILINTIKTAHIESNIYKMSSEQKPFVPKTPIDFQKLKLERLMANPEKPVIIPEMPKEKKGFTVPEFVRNVMGSSAGAGSGEFHVYRHLRRKEYTRQKMIDEKGEKERLDEEFCRKMEENERMIEERTAKKRAKRLKRKEKLKKLKAEGLLKQKKVKKEENQNSSDDESTKIENLDSDEDACEKPSDVQSLESSKESPKGPES